MSTSITRVRRRWSTPLISQLRSAFTDVGTATAPPTIRRLCTPSRPGRRATDRGMERRPGLSAEGRDFCVPSLGHLRDLAHEGTLHAERLQQVVDAAREDAAHEEPADHHGEGPLGVATSFEESLGKVAALLSLVTGTAIVLARASILYRLRGVSPHLGVCAA